MGGEGSGRRKKLVKRVRWNNTVDARLAHMVEILLLDPKRGKVSHGARAALLDELLSKWIEEMTKLPREEALKRLEKIYEVANHG